MTNSEAALARAFENLGATADQARVMAAQLLKRAQQLASERGTSVESALAGLLEKVVAGRQGSYSPEASPPAAAAPAEKRTRGKSG